MAQERRELARRTAFHPASDLRPRTLHQEQTQGPAGTKDQDPPLYGEYDVTGAAVIPPGYQPKPAPTLPSDAAEEPQEPAQESQFGPLYLE